MKKKKKKKKDEKGKKEEEEKKEKKKEKKKKKKIFHKSKYMFYIPKFLQLCNVPSVLIRSYICALQQLLRELAHLY